MIHRNFSPFWGGFDMNKLLTQISQIARFLPSAADSVPAADVAQRLMERAEARAGRHPHQAQELRGAAYAYLSVVR